MDFIDRLDPQLAEVLPRLPEWDLTDIQRARAERRALAGEAKSGWAPPRDVRMADCSVPGLGADPEVRLRVYSRRDQVGAAPLFYWMHGGGHVLGDVDQDDGFLCGVTERTGATCISVDWRRAPEHPYPAAINDAYAGLLWAVHHATELALDNSRVVIGGASSGGGLAAGLALMARDRGEIRLDHQVLIYPMLDDRESRSRTRSYPIRESGTR